MLRLFIAEHYSTAVFPIVVLAIAPLLSLAHMST